MADFYESAAQRRYNELEALKQEALAELARARASDDYDSASTAIETIANVEASKNNLNTLYTQYQASQNPPQPPPVSKEERAARPWDKMDWDDGLDLARTSKYGAKLSHDDPNVRAAYSEVARRRQRGE